MTKKWPRFADIDRRDGEEDDVEMFRRWQVYEREMRALIATGRFHEDSDGWWVETETGELVGPDPEIERPMMEGDEEVTPITIDEALPPAFVAEIRKRRQRK